MPEHDLSEFEQHATTTGRPCEWGQMVAQLDDDRRDKLAAAMVASHLSARQVVRVVASWVGREFSEQAVRYHRRGDCLSCRRNR